MLPAMIKFLYEENSYLEALCGISAYQISVAGNKVNNVIIIKSIYIFPSTSEKLLMDTMTMTRDNETFVFEKILFEYRLNYILIAGSGIRELMGENNEMLQQI